MRIAYSCLVLIVAAAAHGCGRDTCDEVYARETSPDGRFEVVVCRKRMGAAMPGQGGDAPGVIRLRETSTGRVLNEVNIEMVQLFPGVEWEHRSARIRAIADWSLPADAHDTADD